MCKIAPRKYVHMLLILSELIIIACCIIMMVFGYSKNWNKKIWMNSKIRTIKELMRVNNNNSYPIFHINPNGSIEYYQENYASLLVHSGEKCEEHYKKCGILDSLGNIMCIPENDTCPINELKVDLVSNNNLYESKGFQSIPLVNLSDLSDLSEGYVLYYTNNAVEKEIITKLLFSNETPLYINQDNFIFDYETYEDSLKKETDNDGYDYDHGSWDRDWDSGGDWGGGGWDGGGSGGGGWRKLGGALYGDESVTNYILQQMENEAKIDKSFKKINNNLWAKTFMGFKDSSHLNLFSQMDFKKSYVAAFPNDVSTAFSSINVIAFIYLIGMSAIRFCHKDQPNEDFKEREALCSKLFVIIPYLIFFIGYFVYIIYEYCDQYRNKNYEILSNIKGDPFWEDFIAEIKGRYPNEKYIILLIICYSVSMAIFILAWILSHIFTKRYMRFMNNMKKNKGDHLLE